MCVLYGGVTWAKPSASVIKSSRTIEAGHRSVLGKMLTPSRTWRASSFAMLR